MIFKLSDTFSLCHIHVLIQNWTRRYIQFKVTVWMWNKPLWFQNKNIFVLSLWEISLFHVSTSQVRWANTGLPEASGRESCNLLIIVIVKPDAIVTEMQYCHSAVRLRPQTLYRLLTLENIDTLLHLLY